MCPVSKPCDEIVVVTRVSLERDAHQVLQLDPEVVGEMNHRVLERGRQDAAEVDDQSVEASAHSPATCRAAAASAGTPSFIRSKNGSSVMPARWRAYEPSRRIASFQIASTWYQSRFSTSRPVARRVAIDQVGARREAGQFGHPGRFREKVSGLVPGSRQNEIIHPRSARGSPSVDISQSRIDTSRGGMSFSNITLSSL